MTYLNIEKVYNFGEVYKLSPNIYKSTIILQYHKNTYGYYELFQLYNFTYDDLYLLKVKDNGNISYNLIPRKCNYYIEGNYILDYNTIEKNLNEINKFNSVISFYHDDIGTEYIFYKYGKDIGKILLP